MNFDSIEEAVKYIEGLVPEGLNSVKDDFIDIMQKEIETQIYKHHKPEIYERTEQLRNTPTATVNNNYLHAEFEDNGDWTSWKKPHPHFFPMIAWDEWGSVIRSENQGGGTYDKTNILLKSYQKCDEEIPPKFKQFLISKGLNVK